MAARSAQTLNTRISDTARVPGSLEPVTPRPTAF